LRDYGSEALRLPGQAGEANAAREILSGGRQGRSWFSTLLPFLGPAFVASVAYIDPGNFATNISSGAQFGYRLLWVVVLANLIAMLMQGLSAKLGIATGRNLAQVCREELPTWLGNVLFAACVLIAMATDLAEFVGASLGFNLLFHVPLAVGAAFTALATFGILALHRFGFRPVEAVIASAVGAISLCYLFEVARARPDWGQVAYSSVVPSLSGQESLLLAVGILGATVMPHAVLLHSALTQNRIVPRSQLEARRLFRYETADVVIALVIAGLINMAMMMMAAATFFTHGLGNVGGLQEAERTLRPLLGPASGTLFALALLFSGLSSSSVGTMAGQVVFQGFLRRSVSPWLLRVLTMLPALALILGGVDPTRGIVLSQVVLSFGLPFVVIPLMVFTSRADLMGTLVNRRSTKILGSLVTVLIVALNLLLLYQTLG
jgi:manganese transport protein